MGQLKLMHPKALLEACAELVRLTLKFDHPTDMIVSKFFRDNRGLGPRERATLSETVYTVLRKKLLFDHFAPSGSGSKERRLAILVSRSSSCGFRPAKWNRDGAKFNGSADCSRRDRRP